MVDWELQEAQLSQIVLGPHGSLTRVFIPHPGKAGSLARGPYPSKF